MGADVRTSRDVVEPMHGEHRLAGNSLGLSGVLFCIVTGAAPISAMMFNTPVAVLGVGWAAPATFLVATVALTIFSIGYIEMAREVTAAGGFYSFVSHGFGQVMGMGTAILIAACYTIFAAGVNGATTYFAKTTLADWTDGKVDLPVWLLLFGVLALYTGLAYFHIEVTSKILGVFLVSEVIVLIIFFVAILVQGGKDGLSLQPLNPLEIFSNSTGAASVFGATTVGVGLFGAFWSWVGFEMAPNYAEESKEPKKIMAPATYISVIGLGILYILVSWAYVMGVGRTDAPAKAVQSQFNGDIANIYYPVAQDFGGTPLRVGFQLLIVTGSFACSLAFYNTASRYFYSMGRERLIPTVFGKVHPTHRSPYIASFLVSIVCVAWTAGFYWYDQTATGALFFLATWSPLMGVLGILLIQALVSFAIVVYFLKHGRPHPIKTIIAPLLGAAAMLFASWLLFDNRTGALGASSAPFVKYFPYAVIIIFLLGCALALYYRASDKARYDAIGRFVHEDIPAA